MKLVKKVTKNFFTKITILVVIFLLIIQKNLYLTITKIPVFLFS